MSAGNGKAAAEPLGMGVVADRSRLEALESAIDFCALRDARQGTETPPDQVIEVAETFRRYLLASGQLPDRLDTN